MAKGSDPTVDIENARRARADFIQGIAIELAGRVFEWGCRMPLGYERNALLRVADALTTPATKVGFDAERRSLEDEANQQAARANRAELELSNLRRVLYDYGFVPGGALSAEKWISLKLEEYKRLRLLEEKRRENAQWC